MWWLLILILIVALIGVVAVVIERRRTAIGADAREDRFTNPSRIPSWRDRESGGPAG